MANRRISHARGKGSILTPQQEQLLKALPNYAIGWAEKAGFDDIAEDIQKHSEYLRAYKTT